MVHTNYTVASNGTIISQAGQVRHIGRLFFEDSLNDQIVEQGVYANNTHSRTYNEDDPVFDVQNANGYNAYAQYVIYRVCAALPNKSGIGPSSWAILYWTGYWDTSVSLAIICLFWIQ